MAIYRCSMCRSILEEEQKEEDTVDSRTLISKWVISLQMHNAWMKLGRRGGGSHLHYTSTTLYTNFDQTQAKFDQTKCQNNSPVTGCLIESRCQHQQLSLFFFFLQVKWVCKTNHRSLEGNRKFEFGSRTTRTRGSKHSEGIVVWPELSPWCVISDCRD